MKGLLLFISLAYGHVSLSQTYTDAYSAILSGAQINHQSSLSVFYNPSLQAKQTEIGIGSTFFNANSGLYNIQIAYSRRKERHTLSGGLSQEGYQQFNNTTGLIHYALQLDSTWNVGMTVGLTSSNLTTNQTYLPQFAVGIKKQINTQITFSLSMFNQQNQTFQNESLNKRFTQRWVSGLSFHSINKQFSAYLSVQHDQQTAFALALYYRITNRIHFFVSGKTSPVSYAFGGRFNLQSLSLLIGFHYHSYLGFSPSTVAEYEF